MKYKLSDKILFIIVLLLITTYIFVKLFSIRSENILINYVELKSTNLVNSIINKSINNVLFNEKDSLINETNDTEGNIKYIDFDNYKANKIMYLVTEEILSDLTKLEESKYDEIDSKYINSNEKIYYVPLGLIYNSSVISLLGPQIPFKIKYLSSINTQTNINVKEYGINSSLIELLLNIKFQVQVILPFKSKIITIDKTVLLDSKIIQGKVPDYYGGLISGSLK